MIVPVGAQYLPAKGMTQLMKTISRVKKQINPALCIDGILMTLFDNRTNLAKATEATLHQQYGSHLRISRPKSPYQSKPLSAAPPDRAFSPMTTGAKSRMLTLNW